MRHDHQLDQIADEHACDEFVRLSRDDTLTVPRETSTIGARDDVYVLVSTRDKIREALTLVSYRD